MKPRENTRRAVSRLGGWVKARPYIAGIVVVVTVVALYSFWTPSVTLAIEADTEIVELTALDPGAAAFRMASASVDGTCVQQLLVTPNIGTVLTFERVGRGRLKIVIEGQFIQQQKVDGKEVRERKDGGVILVSAPGKECNKELWQLRLPLNGSLVIGQALPQLSGPDESAATLLNGQLYIYARSIGGFGIPPFVKNAVYLANQIPVVGGTIIEVKPASAAEPVEPSWRGYADIDFGDESHRGMRISASVNTVKAHIYLPAPRWISDQQKTAQPDVAAVSLTAKLTGDPNIQLVIILFVLGTTLWKGYEKISKGSKQAED